MNLVKSFVKFVTDAKPVSKIADLEMGRAAVEGVVRLGDDGGIVSPVNGRPCVAFYYKAFYFTGSRTGQMMPRKLRTEEVYHSFILNLEDGRINATPKKTDGFSSDEHKHLSGIGYEGFTAKEDLVSAGQRVRLWGTAKETDDGILFTYGKMEVVGPPESSEEGKPKKKKKKGKAKPKAKPKAKAKGKGKGKGKKK